MEKLVLIGAGGYAKSVLDSIDLCKYQMVGFIDEFSTAKEHLGYPILARGLDELPDRDEYVYFIAIGNNRSRKIWFDKLMDKRLRTINIVDKTGNYFSICEYRNRLFCWENGYHKQQIDHR